MGIQWTRANLSDVSLAGFDGARFVGQAVQYDVPAGWVGFVSGHRVPGGPWATSEEACAAVEAALR